jgi:NADH-quinone oxidoreductase subunit C
MGGRVSRRPAPRDPDLSIPETVVPGTSSSGQELLFAPRSDYHDLVSSLRASGFETLSDLTAVDYLTHGERSLPSEIAPQRFELVVNVLSLSQRRRVRVRVQLPESDLVVDSLCDLYPGAEGFEREAYDMFGVVFRGHPDLTRIMMPEDWEGYPLRKDYAVGRVPVQFKDSPGPR